MIPKIYVVESITYSIKKHQLYIPYWTNSLWTYLHDNTQRRISSLRLQNPIHRETEAQFIVFKTLPVSLSQSK